jgi:hypothetical protein
MDQEMFMQSLSGEECHKAFSPQLRALWFDSKNDWDKAHRIVQAEQDKKSARIHAYLHRKEGDDSNSRYWHRIAGTQFPEDISLQEEWEQLLQNNV